MSWFDSGSGWGDVKGGESWSTGALVLGGMTLVGGLAYAFSKTTLASDQPDPITLADPASPEALAVATQPGWEVPTALWLSPSIALAGLAGLAAYKVWMELQKTPLIALRIKPKQNFANNPERVANMVRDFKTIYNKYPWRKRSWIKWQIVRNEDEKYEFRLIIPKTQTMIDKFKSYLSTCFQNAVISEETPQLPDFFDPYDGDATHMTLSNKKDKTLGIQSDLDNKMGDILKMMQPKSIMEITFSPSSGKDIRKAGRRKVRQLEEQEQKGTDTRAEIAQVRERYSGRISAFRVYIDLWSWSGLGGLASRISDRTERSNKLQGRPYIRMEGRRNPIQYDMRHRAAALWQGNKLTDRELASFLMLPPKNHPVWEHIDKEIVKPPVSNSDFKGSIGIGYIDSDDLDQDGRPARLQIKTLTNHGLVAGAAGGGKGSALSMLVKQDFLQQWMEGKPDSLGMTVCDPHNTFNLLIISYLLDLERKGYKVPWERVKVVSFGYLGNQYPVAMNLLHQFKGDTPDEVATDLAEVILSAFNSEGMSKGVSDLQRSIQCLLYSSQASILDIVRLLEYSPESRVLRQSMIANDSFDNEVVKHWLDKVNDKILKEKKDIGVSSIDTRLSQLVTKKSIQRYHLRKDNYFDVSSILANGDLVLVDFLGAEPESFKLIAGWLSKQYYNRSQKRGASKRPHVLIFDEVQKFKVESIYTAIIRENRKFNCGLILSTQQPDRLDEELAETITSNAGFVLSVRQESGAKKMQPLLGSPFTIDELNQLEKGKEGAIKSDDGKARLKLDYPQFLLDGEPTWKDSDEETEAMNIAKAKFTELLARDHKTATQAEEEVYEYVYRISKPESEVETGGSGGATEQPTKQGEKKSGFKMPKRT